MTFDSIISHIRQVCLLLVSCVILPMPTARALPAPVADSLLPMAAPLSTPFPEDILPGLKEILAAALTQSPQMMLRNIEIAQNQGTFLTSRGQMLPNVSSSASYNVSDAAVSSNTNVTSRSSGLYYSATVNQPLFQWGTLKAQSDASKIQLSIAKKNYVEAYRTLALSIRSQYLALMAKKLAVRNARYAQDQAAAALALEEDKLRNGRSSENLVSNLRLTVEEASLSAERMAEDMDRSKKYFLRQAGLEELSDDSIPTEIPEVGFDPATTKTMLGNFLGHDWEFNNTIEINRSWVTYSDLNYKVAKYRLYPKFSLSASVSQSNSTQASENFVTQVSVNSQYVGVTMTWSIFDGFATKGAKMNTLATKRYYERQLQTQTDQLLDQVVSLERQVGFADRAMKLAQARANISETAVRSLQEDARSGIASRDDVEAAVGAQYRAELALLGQQADFLNRWSEFVSTVGHDPVLQQLPAQYQIDAH